MLSANDSCFRLHKDNTVTKLNIIGIQIGYGFRLHKDNTVTKHPVFSFSWCCSFRLHKDNTVTKLKGLASLSNLKF